MQIVWGLVPISLNSGPEHCLEVLVQVNKDSNDPFTNFWWQTVDYMNDSDDFLRKNGPYD